MQRNNLWLTIEENLAQSWWTWYKWFTDDPDTRGAEPPLDDWDKGALTKLSNLEFDFKAFKKATIPELAPKDKWRLLNVYDVKVPQWIDAGYNRHGKATEGGDLGVAGLWYWNPGDPFCRYDDNQGEYPWKANQVVLFMPDECTDPPTCAQMVAADEVSDVSLLFSQPGREFLSQPT